MEDKAFIRSLLKKNADRLISFAEQQTPMLFEESKEGKWSTGQILSHLIKSISPVNLALRLPRFSLRLLFGKPNRKPRTYEALVRRYLEKLAAGGKAPTPFLPPIIPATEKDKFIKKFEVECSKMHNLMNKWSEDALDDYLVPHPLLGKLTVREMLFFSLYHIEHHLTQLESRSIK